jgi:hypothetical protein
VVKFFWPRICIHSNKLVQRDLALPHHYADGALYGCNADSCLNSAEKVGLVRFVIFSPSVYEGYNNTSN